MWTILSVALAAYQVAAVAFGWTKVSHLTGWRGRVRDAWWIGLGLHFIDEAFR